MGKRLERKTKRQVGKERREEGGKKKKEDWKI